MGKKPLFYHETKPSEEAASVLRSFPTTYDKKPLPTISAKAARKLFCEHSNLTMISASPYKSIGYSKGKHKISKGPCVLLLCLHKGYIPYGEEEFPRKIGGFEVDIQEGSCMLGIGGSLEIGGHIRRKGSKSAGFVNNNGKIGLITCAHGVLALHELKNRTIDRHNNADEVEAFVRKSRSFKVCGKIVTAEFPKNNEAIECSVDAAFIELDSSFSVAGFRNVPAEQLISAGFDAHNPVAFRGTVILNERIGDTSGSVLKFGARTGLTLGSLFNENMHVRIKYKETLKLYDSIGYTDIPCDVNVYNQMEIESLTHDNFFEVGDSGSLVFYIQDDTLCCIGMAIGLTTRGTCLVTPIENILKSLGLPVNNSIFIPAETKLQSNIETDRILEAIDRQQKYIDRRFQEQKEEIEKYFEKIKKNE
ncbi:uncharacterized protein LOC134231532 [Saccostrea cucullata]|uniref:uncharacterized protein LOC134231532 n=1 Tax=Saccostrea cuccullata TaxID=36930 RepID=UPI002ED32303